MKGYVYILSNPCLPGIVKIGRTSRSVQQRASELYQTGVPAPFVIEYERKTPDCARLEALMHDFFGDQRVNADREFFSVTIEDAKQKLDEFEDEVLYEWLEEFRPGWMLTPEDEFVDGSDLRRLADDLGREVSEISLSIGEVPKEAVQWVLDEKAARRARWEAREAQERLQ